MVGGLLTKATGIVLDVFGQRGGAIPDAATLYDKSRYGSHGAITGAVWVQEPSGLWVLDYDSDIPSYVEIPAAHTQLNFTSGDFSIIARIKLDVLTDRVEIFSRRAFISQGYSFLILSNGMLLALTGIDTVSMTSAGDITTGSHLTVGLSRTGTSIKLYIGGIDETAIPGVHADPLSATASAFIGIDASLVSYPLDGKMEFLRIFNYALSPGQHLKAHEALRRWV